MRFFLRQLVDHSDDVICILVVSCFLLFCGIINLYLTVYPHLMEGENQFNREQPTRYLGAENEYGFTNDNENISVDKRSTKEKVTVVLVLITGFLAVILGITQMSSSIKKPLTDLILLAGNDTGLPSEASAVLAQQLQDTDGDGLSDYDELNVYGTSPYLDDSDSDGVLDKAEIDAGHDPNCPGSDTCFRTDTTVLNTTLSPTDQKTLLSASSDPKVIRELLIKNGFPKEQLDAITDAQLLATYQQAILGQSPTVSSNINTTSSTTSLSQINIKSIDDLKNLTGAQIRQLMISQGAPADVLSQVSDEELKTMFLTKLNSQSN